MTLREDTRARAGGAPAPPPPLTPHERELALAVAALGGAVEDTARTLQPHPQGARAPRAFRGY